MNGSISEDCGTVQAGFWLLHHPQFHSLLRGLTGGVARIGCGLRRCLSSPFASSWSVRHRRSFAHFQPSRQRSGKSFSRACFGGGRQTRSLRCVHPVTPSFHAHSGHPVSLIKVSLSLRLCIALRLGVPWQLECLPPHHVGSTLALAFVGLSLIDGHPHSAAPRGDVPGGILTWREQRS